MKKYVLAAIVCFVLTFAFSCGIMLENAMAEDNYFYISVDGDDNAAGTFEHPFKTINGAKKYLAEHKDELNGDVIVFLRGGEYLIEEQISFDENDLGGVIYRPYNNESVTIGATTELKGFSETTVNGVRAFVKQTDLKFNTLYHSTRTINTPRYPESGNFTVKSVDHSDDLFTESTTYWDSSRGNTSFNADLGEVTVRFSRPTDVYARITHAWLDEISKINFFDEKTGKVGIARPATYMISPGDVYWFENVFEELDKAGEWYLDQAEGKLYYVPFEGETTENLVLFAPVSRFLMEIDGCDDIVFERIRFKGSEWTLSVTPDGNGIRTEYNIDAYQASIECDSAINVQNADGIIFHNCEFIDIGNTALKFNKNCHHCTIENSIFRNIGSTAIAIYGENVKPDAENASEIMSDFYVVNNLVEGYGRNTYESTGVHIMYVKDSVVSNNEIHDGYYTGLSCGWIWGHEYQVTENIQITENLIYDIGQGWLSDLGGMYLLGEQRGTVIARNVIYNVTRGKGKNDYGGNGIYTDAGSSYFTIEQNLIYDCAANGLNIGGYNRGHVVRNNVVAYCKLSQFDPGWGDGNDDDCTADCYNNVFYACGVPVILDLGATVKFVEKNNILWDEKNGAAVFGSTGYSGRYEKKTKISVKQANRNGFLLNDIFADPLFVDAENRNFNFKEDSPVFADGYDFVVWDYSQAGLKAEVEIGCGGEWNRGTVFRYNDLSDYPDACSDEMIPYWPLAAANRVFPTMNIVFLALVLAIAIALMVVKNDLKPIIKIALVVAAPVAFVCVLFVTGFLQDNALIAYYSTVAVFGLATAIPSMVLIKNKWLKLLPLAAHIGLFIFFAFFFQHIASFGAQASIVLAEIPFILSALVCSAVIACKKLIPAFKRKGNA